MKKTTAFILVLLFISHCFQSQGQEKKEKQSKKTTIKIVTEENGKKTVIDTTFLNTDQDEIDEFLENRQSDKKRAPVPPRPPAPLPPLPPLPPTPPLDEKDFQSFNFHFEMPDVDIDFEIDEELERAQQSLEIAKEGMERHFKNAKISIEEIEKVINEKVKVQVEREMRKFKNELKKNNRERKEIIIKKKKVGENREYFNNDNTGFNFQNDGSGIKYVYSSSSEKNGEPIIYNGTFSGSGMDQNMKIYTFIAEKKPTHSKFRRFIKRVSDKILD